MMMANLKMFSTVSSYGSFVPYTIIYALGFFLHL